MREDKVVRSPPTYPYIFLSLKENYLYTVKKKSCVLFVIKHTTFLSQEMMDVIWRLSGKDRQMESDESIVDRNQIVRRSRDIHAQR